MQYAIQHGNHSCSGIAYLEVAERVDLKSSRYKKKKFYNYVR